MLGTSGKNHDETTVALMSADEYIGLLNTTIMNQNLDSGHVVVKVT